MRVFVNAVALRDAGGRSVALNFLRAVGAAGTDHSYYVVAPPGRGYESVAQDNVLIDILPKRAGDVLARPLVDRVWLPRLVDKVRPDVVFSMGNLPVPTTAVPQLVLFHWPYAIYPESPAWRRMDRRSRWLRKLRLRAFVRGLRYATAFAAQTRTAKRRLGDIYAVSNVCVVPNAVSITPIAARLDNVVERQSPDERLLLCLSRYYPHKNIEALVEVARIVRHRGEPFRFIITIDESQHKAAGELLRRVAREGLGGIIRNIGPVSMETVPSLYRSVDGMILPTLLESFSGTYVEAMHYGVPVFTSDLDFARDVCGGAAFYFDPLDPDSIHRALVTAFDDASLIDRAVAEGKRAVARMPDWNAVAAAYVRALTRVAGGLSVED